MRAHRLTTIFRRASGLGILGLEGRMITRLSPPGSGKARKLTVSSRGPSTGETTPERLHAADPQSGESSEARNTEHRTSRAFRHLGAGASGSGEKANAEQDGSWNPHSPGSQLWRDGASEGGLSTGAPNDARAPPLGSGEVRMHSVRSVRSEINVPDLGIRTRRCGLNCCSPPASHMRTARHRRRSTRARRSRSPGKA